MYLRVSSVAVIPVYETDKDPRNIPTTSASHGFIFRGS